MVNFANKVFGGTIWTLCEKFSCQIVGFVVGMILARLLTPSMYGTVALTAIFFAVGNVIIDCGFSGALIQKKNSDDLDFNSVFYLNVSMSLVVYAILFCSAGVIAEFYKTPQLASVVRVGGISLVFNAVNAVQNAELMKKMLFKKNFKISIITCSVSGIVGVTLALLDFGVWALVLSTLTAGFVGVIARWWIIAWRPRIMFSWGRLKPLFCFGWKMSLSGLLDQFFANLSGLLIGRFYTKDELAFVNKGNALPSLAENQINGTLCQVAFPALVQFQDSPCRLRDAVRRMIQCSLFFVVPIMVVIAVCSEAELRLLYGEKWVPASPYMVLASFALALGPLHAINIRAMMALGASDKVLLLEIVKKVLYIVCVVVSFRFGVFAFVATTAFVLGPLSVIVNTWPNRKLICYPLEAQIKDAFPVFAVGFIEAGATVFVGWAVKRIGFPFVEPGTNLYLFLLIVLQGCVALFCYVAVSLMFKIHPVIEIWILFGGIVKKRMPNVYSLVDNWLGVARRNY